MNSTSSFSGYGTGATAGSIQTGSPDRHYTRETSYSETRWGAEPSGRRRWAASARDNKGLAIGAALAALVAAIVPFMLVRRRSGSLSRSTSRSHQYDYDITTGQRRGSVAEA